MDTASKNYWCPVDEPFDSGRMQGSTRPDVQVLDDWAMFAEELPSLLERQILIRRRRWSALMAPGVVRVGFPV